jgi:pimeloyl-ACP methyl ester carboxylesterase
MKKNFWKNTAIGLLVLLAAILIVPLLVPVPALENVRPPQELADPDSIFLEINGLDVHVKTKGEGRTAFILLHGFGASLYSWNAVMEPISAYGKVIAFDRPAFGLTERPLEWEGENPYTPESQIKLILGLMDHYAVEKAILVGNSAGGSLAMQFALAQPERVQGLILVDPAVYSGGGAPAFIRPLLATPQARHIGPLIVRQFLSGGSDLISLAWHDPQKITLETVELYRKAQQVENWDAALWEFTIASHTPNLVERLAAFEMPVMVITGDDDRIVPTEQSLRLAEELPNASLAVIENAGHVPHEEQPQAFMQAIQPFVTDLISR